MPVDPIAFLDSILTGLSKVPPALLAAALLAGPTAIWLIARFTNPPDYGMRFDTEVVGEQILWVCGSCRSLNVEGHDHCYHCHLMRASTLAPMILPAGRAGQFDVGIPVGPGGLTPVPTTGSWLGIEARQIATGPADATWPAVATEPSATNGIDDFDETAELGETTRPDAVPVPARAPVVEPRMTVSGRPPARDPNAFPAPRPAARRAGEATPKRVRRRPES
jgi:hypothetical protein